MFFVDANILMGVLIPVTIVAYILILRALKSRTVSPKARPKNLGKVVTKRKKPSPPPKTSNNAAKQERREPLCLHHFGYLSDLPKQSSLPDECLGCPKVMQCLAIEESEEDSIEQ